MEISDIINITVFLNNITNTGWSFEVFGDYTGNFNNCFDEDIEIQDIRNKNEVVEKIGKYLLKNKNEQFVVDYDRLIDTVLCGLVNMDQDEIVGD